MSVESDKALGIVIIGGNGFLGSHLARYLRRRARVVLTYVRNPVPIEGVLSLPIDTRDTNVMKRLLYAQQPDAVVYLAGTENPAWVEKDPKLAEKVISTAAGDALHTAEILSAKFLYISSTLVFDGTRGNYKETDNVSPTTLLGKLKAGGENLVRGRAVNAAVLRFSPLVGSAHPWRPSFFDRLRKSLESGEAVELLHDEYHSWLPVSSAVTAIAAAIERAPKSALYHLGGLTRLTPYEMGLLFARTLGYDETRVLPKKRPIQKGMIILPEGQKFDFSLNSSEIIRGLDVKTAPIEETLAGEFSW
jgi:dTDP-4-dehydrorhamnose reductase